MISALPLVLFVVPQHQHHKLLKLVPNMSKKQHVLTPNPKETTKTLSENLRHSETKLP